MPKPYSQLAKWYDQLKDDDFYRRYGVFIKRIAKQHSISEVHVLDIACDTGRLLADLTPDVASSTGIEQIYSDFKTEVTKEGNHQRLIVVAKKVSELLGK